VLDRIDTWLIAGVISYLMILFLNKINTGIPARNIERDSS
jgi:hypothetical protein